MTTAPALNHVAVTVRDIDASGPWYEALIGAEPLLDEHTAAGFRHLVWALPNGTLFGIHQHDRAAENEKFTEFRVGLDHVGLRVCEPRRTGAVARPSRRTRRRHEGIVDEHYGSGLSFRDPDGIALEFFAPPG